MRMTDYCSTHSQRLELKGQSFSGLGSTSLVPMWFEFCMLEINMITSASVYWLSFLGGITTPTYIFYWNLKLGCLVIPIIFSLKIPNLQSSSNNHNPPVTQSVQACLSVTQSVQACLSDKDGRMLSQDIFRGKEWNPYHVHLLQRQQMNRGNNQ